METIIALAAKVDEAAEIQEQVRKDFEAGLCTDFRMALADDNWSHAMDALLEAEALVLA